MTTPMNGEGLAELSERAIEGALENGFGKIVHWWPSPDREAPKWWQFKRAARERRINAVLTKAGFGPVTDEMRAVYWREARKGQDITEDAGGYCWRCWAAMLGLPFTPAAFTYSGYVNREVEPDHPAFKTGIADVLR